MDWDTFKAYAEQDLGLTLLYFNQQGHAVYSDTACKHHSYTDHAPGKRVPKVAKASARRVVAHIVECKASGAGT
jgi:hypothetical protein